MSKDTGSSEVSPPLFRASLRLPGERSGKVRDTFTLPTSAAGDAARLLIVASDRISAFDVIMPTPIPGKGRVLTRIAEFWLRWIESNNLCGTHLLSTNAAEVPGAAFDGAPCTRDDLEGRVTIGSLCRVIPIECVVRGYLEGSGWKDYQRTGEICGVKLPEGLRQCDRLPEPIFTPATKATEGHDENISFARAAEQAGTELMEWLRDTSLRIYERAAAYALDRGIIIADTKFEFGMPIGTDGEPTGGDPIVIDEALTPDSSRFWPADLYEPGHSQPSFDKQFVREHLQELVDAGSWDKSPPGPELPVSVVEGTIARYREAAARLIGS